MSTDLNARRASARAAPSLSRLRPAFLLPLALAALPALCRAAEADELQIIVITATRIPTPVLQVASSITVVTAADIEARQERTFADVLKDIPGLNVVQTGGPGGETSVFMRGTNSNHTKVFIDGIDVSDPSNPTGAFDFGQLLTQDIERVEVLRGPQSGLYGSDAIGGVIDIITKSGNGPAQFTAAAEGGTFDTFNQAGTVSGSDGAFHYSASVAHFHAGATPVTPLDLLLPGEARIDDYDDNLTLSTKLGLDVTPDFDLGLVARYTDVHLRNSGEDYLAVAPFTGYPAPEQTTADTVEYATRLTAHLKSFDGVLEQTLGLAYTHDRTDTVEPQTPPALNTGERRKADWQGDVKFDPTETLVLGAEYERDEIDQPITADVHIGSAYGELQSQIGDHWFSALNVRNDDNSRFGDKTTWRFAPVWLVTQTDTKLHASVGTGFKAPTLSELYQSFPAFFFFANPNLKPESSTGWDAGIEQAVVHDVLRVGVTYYYNRIRDLITTDVTGTTWANVGRATTDGIESFIAYQPLRELTLRVDYTYTQAEDDVLEQPLLRRPKHRGSFLATWQATRAWQWNLDVLAVGNWVDVSRDGLTSGLSAPGYTTVNLATSYDLTPRVALFARVDNLLDRHYENPIGFLQPSIGVYAGLKVRL
ncbi:MAG TPA: TonB-dependent receptor [Steroidobacteraceae bacterium]|jgi:vitamin B12 transporter|nr:TonB-dependent receptor [Steroidobacteraceae bacterium]